MTYDYCELHTFLVVEKSKILKKWGVRDTHLSMFLQKSSSMTMEVIDNLSQYLGPP